METDRKGAPVAARNATGRGYVLPPDALPGFSGARRIRPKTPMPGGGLRARWKDDKGIYEWDYQHGAVEAYTKRGKHTGQFDPVTGARQKPADPSKEVEP